MAKGHKSTVTHSADAATNAMSQNVYDASKRAAAGYTPQGVDPSTSAAMGLFGDMAGYGKVGAGALAGDQASIDKMMNPYLAQVLGGYNEEFGNASAMLRKNNNDAATQAGAFGGDRAALEQVATQGELGRAHLSHVADLLHGGYNDAMTRAGGLANLGLSAGGAQFAGGDYLRGVHGEMANPEVMRQQLLAAGLQGGNVGNSTDTNYTKTSAMQNILGAGATIGGLFGGGGGLMQNLFGGGGMFGSQGGAGLFGNTADVRKAGMTPPGGFKFDPSMVNLFNH
jgi:hypothetical protein